GVIGLTLPMSAPSRFKGLLVMNTALTTAKEPLTEGFLAWRAMCNSKPDFDIGRLLKRAQPQLSDAEASAYNAPFPDSGFRAATRAFPNLVPEKPTDEGAVLARAAQDFLKQGWQGKACMVMGEADPVFNRPLMLQIAQQIHACIPPMGLGNAGHFVPEHYGKVIAEYAIANLS
ncbi:MAG: tRNA adenosine(34) deaminase TadA, partial [Gammaproteobacteria bacterium]|nr:tRNA adenosine(34) deaminase TadA [Gammaproteobacteria bacterium]